MRLLLVTILAMTSIFSYSQNHNNVDSILLEIYKKDQAIRRETVPEFQSGDTERFLVAHAKMQTVDADNQAVEFALLNHLGCRKVCQIPPIVPFS